MRTDEGGGEAPALAGRPGTGAGQSARRAETPRRRASRLALAGLMLVAGTGHFLATGTYALLIPRGLGDPRAVVLASGVAEIACGVLLVVPRTRRLGGWCTAALLVAVFPGNVQMALDGGLDGHGWPLGSPVAAWLRLPLQVPLVLWALSHARGPRTPG